MFLQVCYNNFMCDDILSMLQSRAQTERCVMHMPAHLGQGVIEELAPFYALDTTETGKTDDLYHAKHSVHKAMQEAAQLLGAEFCFFGCEGSSALLKAAMMALVPVGGEVLIERSAHVSVYYGALLCGAKVRYMPRGADCAAYETFLCQHPQVRVCVLTSPDYFGRFALSAPLIKVLQRHHVRVIVDESHGTHLYFASDCAHAYPLALPLGCDVVVHSAHKTLGALTGCAMISAKKKYSDALLRCIQMLSSTSPNYVLLASIQAALRRADLHREQSRELCASLKSLHTWIDRCSCFCSLQGCIDPFKLWLRCPSGYDGYACEADLQQRFGIYPEFALPDGVLCYLGLLHKQEHLDKLRTALCRLSELYGGCAQRQTEPCTTLFGAQSAMDMHTAFFSPQYKCPLKQAEGKVSADFIVLYPPGNVLLAPGEVFTSECIDVLCKFPELYGVNENHEVSVVQ